MSGLRDNRALYMENDGKSSSASGAATSANPGSSFVRRPGSYNDGNWHQATTVYNGTNNITLYMDGKQVGDAQHHPAHRSRARATCGSGYMDLARFYTVFGRTTTASRTS